MSFFANAYYTFMVFCLRLNYFLLKNTFFICIACDFVVVCLEIVSHFLEVKEVIEVKEVKANSFLLEF